MSSMRADAPAFRLDAPSYEPSTTGALRLLEMPIVHPQHFRSRLGDDFEANLITLCLSCQRSWNSSHRDGHLEMNPAALGLAA